MTAFGYEKVTIDDTARYLADAFFQDATRTYFTPVSRIWVTVEDAQIRFCVDGSVSTVTVGHILNPGDVLELDGNEGKRFNAIRVGAVSGSIRVTYEK